MNGEDFFLLDRILFGGLEECEDNNWSVRVRVCVCVVNCDALGWLSKSAHYRCIQVAESGRIDLQLYQVRV